VRSLSTAVVWGGRWRGLLLGLGVAFALPFGAAAAQDIRLRLARVVTEQQATPILAEGARGQSARLHQRRAVEAALTAAASQLLIERPGQAAEIGRALAGVAPSGAGPVIATLSQLFPGLAPALTSGAGLPPQPTHPAPAAAPGAMPALLEPGRGDARQNAERAAASAALIAVIAVSPATLETAVRQAIAERPAERQAILQAARNAYPGFAERIDRAATAIPPPLPAAARAAAAPPAPAARPAALAGAGDPLEDVNRAMFAVNDTIDVALLRPLAWTYNKLVPDPAILAIRRFFDNLGTPAILANDLLQGTFADAGTTVARFLVNSTAGVGGLFEVAADLGLPRHGADFGQTLHSYGVTSGPYLVLPLLGPANLRDGIGRAVDMSLDPLSYVLPAAASIGLTAGKAVSAREEFLHPLDDLKATSLDYYGAVRSLYTLRRAVGLNKGRPLAQDKELDELFEAAE